MMITRFNADSKSKIKFTAGERLAIGAASMMGISHRAAKEAVDVSRTYYYELGQKVEPLLEAMTAADEIARSVILVTEEFIERSVTALHTVCNTSESAILYFMEQVCGVTILKGKLYDILKAAEEKAAAHDAGVSLEGIEVMATDEIFQGNQPILTAVDPVSGYVFMAESAEDRSGETWQTALEEQKEKGLDVKLNVQREIPDAQFPLLKMMLNTKKCHRSRKPERIGSSALDRLTGLDTPDFLDALLGTPHYILSIA